MLDFLTIDRVVISVLVVTLVLSLVYLFGEKRRTEQGRYHMPETVPQPARSSRPENRRFDNVVPLRAAPEVVKTLIRGSVVGGEQYVFNKDTGNDAA